jgi:hypothetical protein
MVWDLKQQGIYPEVFWDDEHEGPWWTARRFWVQLEEEYGVLLQDDIELGAAFKKNVEGVVEKGKIETMASCMWISSNIQKAYNEGKRYLVNLVEIWGQCNIARKDFIEDVVEWSDRVFVPEFDSDDMRYRGYMWEYGLTCIHTVPSLVQHKTIPSLRGNIVGKSRQSRVVADREYDWERTREKEKRMSVKKSTGHRPYYRDNWEGENN